MTFNWVWLWAGLGDASGLDFFVAMYVLCGGLSCGVFIVGRSSGEGERSGIVSSRYLLSAS